MLEHKNRGLVLLLDENVILHVDIDEGEIVNFTYYNSLSHPSSQIERIGKVFFVNFLVVIPSLIVVLKLLPHLPSPCERVGGAFFLSKFVGNISRLYK
jgi:hypothetical protein